MRHQKTRHKLSRNSRAPQGAAAQPLQGGHRARADQDDRGQGQGRQARGRAADHARQARRPARPPPGAVGARPGQVRRPQAVRGGRAALRGAARRLHPHPQARPASQRLDRDGLPRAGLGAPGPAGHGAVPSRPPRHRVRRHGLRRLGAAAGPADGPGRARARRSRRCCASRCALTVAGRTDARRPRAGPGRLVRGRAGAARGAQRAAARRRRGAARATRRRTASTRAATRARAPTATACWRAARARRSSAAVRCGGRTALDRDAAARAAPRLLPGTHDFTAFTPTETDHVRFERDVLDARWVRARATCSTFWIEADAFMRHMNRVLVGTMLEVAGGRRALGVVRGAAATARPRDARPARPAPPHGLALAGVALRRRPGAGRRPSGASAATDLFVGWMTRCGSC